MITRSCCVFLVSVWLVPVWAESSKARRIEERFIAPCCWSESVAVHRSEVAAEMRAEIERMVAQGASEDQIVDAYVARHGEKILMEPRGANRSWLTFVPVALIAIAAAGLIAYIRRQRHFAVAASNNVNPPALRKVELDDAEWD